MGTRGGSLWGHARARPHLSAALLLALPVLVYLWPALVGGQMLSATSILYALPPWASHAPSDLTGDFNFVLVDVGLAIYPWREYARELLHDGVLPIWNPHVFAGVPFWSNPQNGLFSPFNLPLWVLPLNYALGLSAALKLWAGAFGSYLLARQLRLGFLPGLLAGVAFAFSSLNIVWLTHETLPAVAVMLPWMVWLVERIFERGRLGDAIGLAVVTAIAIGGGHPGMQVHAPTAVALYVLLRAAFAQVDDRRTLLRPLALAGAGMAAGALLMAAMLIPEALSSRGTIGTAARQGGEGSLPGTNMPFDAVKTVLFPDWWGRPSAIEAPGGQDPVAGVVNYNERTFYAGVVALLLAAVGLLSASKWRRKAPFAILGALGLAVPLHAPGVYWLATHLPVFELVQSQRLHFVFAFAVSVLAAFGLHAVMELPEHARRRMAVPAAALLLGLIALAAVDAQPGDFGDTIEHFVSGTDFGSAGILAYTSIGWYLLFALGVGIALAAAVRWPARVAAIATTVVVLAVGDALHFARGYQPMAPASKMIPPETPAIAYLRERADEGRIAGVNNALINDWSQTYGLRDVRGYDPPYPTERYFRLWRAAAPEQLDWTPFSLSDLGSTTAAVTAVLGARFVVTGPGLDQLPPDASGRPPFTRVYAGEDATIFRNDRAVPRTMVASEVILTGDEGETRGAILSEGFDPRRTAVVERSGSESEDELANDTAPVRGTARVVSEENTRVRLQASLDRRGLVVLNDQLVDGWSVTVDGRDADVVRVNSVMRGVVVPGGEHEIEWRYAMPGLRAGFILSFLTGVALLALLLAGPVWARRRQTSSTAGVRA